MAHVTQGELLKSINADSAELVKQSKALAHALNNRKYKQSDVYTIMQRCADYIQEQRDKRQPLTVAGFILASGIPESSWYEAKNGDKDNITTLYQLEHPQQVQEDGTPYYVDEATGETKPLVTLSEVVKNCHLLIQAQLEGNCYTNKGNPAGSIFGLKAQFGWTEDNTPQHQQNIQIIADADKALEALKMLT